MLTQSVAIVQTIARCKRPRSGREPRLLHAHIRAKNAKCAAHSAKITAPQLDSYITIYCARSSHVPYIDTRGLEICSHSL